MQLMTRWLCESVDPPHLVRLISISIIQNSLGERRLCLSKIRACSFHILRIFARKRTMKLGSTAALSLALAVSATAGVSGFVPSLDHHAAIGRGTRNSADGAQPHLSVAAAPVDEAMDTASASSDDQQIPITDVNSVKSLSFRQLQRACVARSLPAVGSTAALRSRLLDSAGLPDVSAPAAPQAVEDEVSRGFENEKEINVCKLCVRVRNAM